MHKYVLLLLVGLGFCLPSYSHYLIEGTVHIDEAWAPVVYLSAIPSFEDMFTVSTEMIALQAPIDSLGNFRFEGDYLPEGDRLYRLHLSKKGDPPSTIIIGGKDENHMFLIANSDIQCRLTTSPKGGIWNQISFSACAINPSMQQIDKLIAQYESDVSSDYSLGREFLKISLDKKLRYFADTTQNLLVSLYALHHTRLKTHVHSHPDYYRAYLDKWEGITSPYLTEFRRELKLPPDDKNLYLYALLLGLGGLVLGLVLRPYWPRINNKQLRDTQGLFQKLSQQERKIFSLIREGKSNKEISQELHIELTTVKSHIRNMYGKLELTSRKEVLDFFPEPS